MGRARRKLSAADRKAMSEAVRTARGNKSLREFAALLGVSYGAVNGWEKEEYPVGLNDALAWMQSPVKEVQRLGIVLHAILMGRRPERTARLKAGQFEPETLKRLPIDELPKRMKPSKPRIPAGY